MPDIGPIVAKSIFKWFKDKKNLDLLVELGKAGVKIKSPNLPRRQTGSQFPIPNSNSIFKDKTVVLTGTLNSLTREKAKAKIRELGGDISESVSSKTSYVVVGLEPGSKADKAKKLGATTLSEKDFLKLIK